MVAIYLTLLTNVNLSVGLGFGLFAIFSLLRYRTNTIAIEDMTYLFTITALPVINAFLLEDNNWRLPLATNIFIILLLYILEQGWGFRYQSSQRIIYEKIELIKPEHYGLLLADLRQRTGLPVARVEIGRINFLQGAVDLTIFYDESSSN